MNLPTQTATAFSSRRFASLALLHGNPPPGPDHPSNATLLGLALDQIDHGMILLSLDGEVCYRNRAAAIALGEPGGSAAWTPRADARLLAAIDDCARGLRSMVTLWVSDAPMTAAVIPLPSERAGEPSHALLVLARAKVCQPLALEFFAKVHGLTPAESAVMRELCNGNSPRVIAELHGVRVSTVRTQISSLRQKTGTLAIGDLVRMLTLLPPMRTLFN